MLPALLVASLLASCKDGDDAPAAEKVDAAPKKKKKKADADDGKSDAGKGEADGEWKSKKQAERELPKALSLDTLPPPDEPPKLKVLLPPKPSFPAGAIPAKHPDGVWSVIGIREDLDPRVAEGDKGVEIELRAYVQEIYVPPECPEGEVCPPGKQPHVWVTDAADQKGKRLAMMVVNYAFQIPEWDAKRWEDEPMVILEKGKQYTFKGTIRQFSDTGFADERGLLQFVAVKLTNEAGLEQWVYPPSAPWHPAEIARQEAENAALVEKSKAAAGR